MLPQIRERIHSNEQGFTLIELLVVILIIGILAAIALPAFLGEQSKAQDSSAKSDARNLVTQMEACYVDTRDYTLCDPPQGTGLNIGSGPGEVEVVSPTVDDYAVVAHSKSGNNFRIEKVPSGEARTCDTAGKGSCLGTAGNGTW